MDSSPQSHDLSMLLIPSVHRIDGDLLFDNLLNDSQVGAATLGTIAKFDTPPPLSGS